MAQMKMLRQVMSPADIYTHADTICDMLRDHYGSYDADSLDEVMVEETFAQRLAAKGYDLLPEGAEPDDRPMAPPPPSRRELPRAEISQVPVRRPAQNGGVPLRRREPSGDSEGQLPLRRDGEGGLPMRRTSPAVESDRGGPMRRRPMDGDMSSPLRRRPATGEGDNVSLPRRRPMQPGDVGPLRSRPEGPVSSERPPLQRQELTARDARPAPEPQSAPDAARNEQPPVPAQVGPPVAAVELANVAPEPNPLAPTAVHDEAAQSPAIEVAAPVEAKPAPKPRARRTTRAKIASSESSEPQSEG